MHLQHVKLWKRVVGLLESADLHAVGTAKSSGMGESLNIKIAANPAFPGATDAAVCTYTLVGSEAYEGEVVEHIEHKKLNYFDEKRQGD
jgi:hypothetical protein